MVWNFFKSFKSGDAKENPGNPDAACPVDDTNQCTTDDTVMESATAAVAASANAASTASAAAAATTASATTAAASTTAAATGAQIGTANIINGQVIAIALDGAQRVLETGDPVFANEVIQTIGSDSSVAIAFNDGSNMFLGRESSAQLDQSVYDPQAVAAQIDSMSSDVDALQQAILAGADPTEVLEAPAAGEGAGGPSDGTVNVVSVDRTGALGDVFAGYETKGLQFEVQRPEFIPGVEDDEGEGGPGTPEIIVTPLSLTLEEESSPSVSGNDEADGLNYTQSGNFSSNINVSLNSVTSIAISGSAYSVPQPGATTIYFDVDGNSQGTNPTDAAASLTVNSDGSWTMTVTDRMEHDPVQGENSLNLPDISIEVDTAGGSASIPMAVTVVDDVPELATDEGGNPLNVGAVVEEDDMRHADGDRSTGNNEDGSSNYDEASDSSGNTVGGNLNYLVSAGADAPMTFSLNGDNSALAQLPQLMSNGEQVVYSTSGNTLTASTSAGVIFTLTINSDGSWEFDLQDQLDHVAGGDENFDLVTADGSSVSNIDFTSLLNAVDADGDSVDFTGDGEISGLFTIAVQDDVPVVATDEQGNPATVSATIEEDDMRFADGDLSDGNNEDGSTNNDEASGASGNTTGGNLTTLIADGADETVTFNLNNDPSVLTQLPTLFSNGEAVSYSVSGDTLTASTSAGVVFTLTVGTDGAWSFDLNDQLDHVAGDGENFALRTSPDGSSSVNHIDFTVLLEAEDADGDPVDFTGSGQYSDLFTISIQDDVPELATDENGNPARVSAAVEEDDMRLVDGDLSDGNNEDGTVNNDEASDSSANSTGGNLNSLVADGADESVTFSLDDSSSALSQLPTLYSNGEAVVYSVSGDTLTGTTSAGTVFTLTVNPDGSWNFDLNDQLDHVAGDGENFALRTSPDGSTFVDNIDFTPVLVATDADGDTLDFTGGGQYSEIFSITVQDDVPVANTAGERSFELTVTNHDYASEAQFNNSYGYYVMDDNGNPIAGHIIWSDMQDPNATTATVTITGYEMSEIGFFIIPDGQTYNGGLTDGTDVSFRFEGGEWNAYDGSGNLLTGVDTNAIFDNAALNVDGTNHFTDNGVAGNQNWEDLLVPGGDEDFDDVNVNVEWKETTTGVVAATIEEDDMTGAAGGDRSEGNNEDGTVDHDEASDSSANTIGGNLNTLVSDGADENVTFTISSDTSSLPTLYSNGEQVSYNVSGNTLTASSSAGVVFTLTVNPDGTWNFDLQDQLDHVDNGLNNENFELQTDTGFVDFINFTSILDAVDADGDPVDFGDGNDDDALFYIRIQDDIPVLATDENGNPARISAAVEEDDMRLADGDLSDGNNEDGSVNNDEASDSSANSTGGDLTALIADGADENVTFSLNDSSDALSQLPTLYSNGEAVVYSVAGDTLTASTSAGTVFTLTVNPDGTWNFDLNDQLDHVAGDGENFALRTSPDGSTFVDNIDFTPVLAAVDADGDEVDFTGGGQYSDIFSITVQDDVPVANTAGDRSFELTVTNHDYGSEAAFQNSYGYYVMDENGNPTVGHIIWSNVQDPASSTATVTITGYEPSEIGFFLIPDGQTYNGGLTDGTDVTFQFEGGQWNAYDGSGNLLTGVDTNAIFDRGALNVDNTTHVEDNAAPGEQNWEDLLVPGGDSDFDDVNIDVAWKETTTGVVTATVEEDDMTGVPGGDRSVGNNEDGSIDNDEASDSSANTIGGNLNTLVSDGADENVTFSISNDGSDINQLPTLYSNGEMVVYDVSGNTLTASTSAGTVFMLMVNGDGTWEFDLQDQLDHVDNGLNNENLGLQSDGDPVDFINFTSILVAVDADGDPVDFGDGSDDSALFYIRVQDDVPVANDDFRSMSEDDAPISGNVFSGDQANNAGAADSYGSDERNDNAPLVLPNTDGGDYAILTGTYGTLHLYANGEYTYTVTGDVPTDGAQESFGYTVQDSDGDIANANLVIDINGVDDPDDPGINVHAPGDVNTDDITVPEGSDAVFEVTINDAADGSTVTLTLHDGTAVDADYNESHFQYSFDGNTWYDVTGPIDVPEGNSSMYVSTDTVNDFFDDPGETFDLKAELNSNGTLVDDTGTATIEECEINTVLAMVVQDDFAMEGGQLMHKVILVQADENGEPMKDGSGEYITINAVTPVTVTLAYGVDNDNATDNATQGDDYSGPLTVTIDSGFSYQYINVDALTDGVDENNEVYTIQATDAQGGGFEGIQAYANDTSGEGIATGTIEDVDDPGINVHAPGDVNTDDITVPEGSDAVFEVSINDAANGSTVTLSLHDGTATDADYNESHFQYSFDGNTWYDVTGPIDVPEGNSSMYVSTDTVNDYFDDPGETFDLKAELNSNGTLVDDTGTATIEECVINTVLAMVVQDDFAQEGGQLMHKVILVQADENGEPMKDGNGEYITIDATTPVTVTLGFGTDNDAGTDDATQGDDYTGPATVTIDAGFSYQYINVDALIDGIDENSEVYTIQATDAQGGGFEAIQAYADDASGEGVATGTIEDIDDPGINVHAPGDVNTDDITVPEGNDAVFEVDISNAAQGSTVTLTLSDGTAVDADYNEAHFQYSFDGINWFDVSGPIDVPAGNSSMFVSTDTVDDSVDEPDETFDLKAELNSNGVLVDDTGTATIIDNDDPVICGPKGHDISNMVLYLQADNGDITKVKIDSFGSNIHAVNVAALLAVDYSDFELVAYTVKAGQNSSNMGPGEGELIILDPQLTEADMPVGKADVELDQGQLVNQGLIETGTSGTGENDVILGGTYSEVMEGGDGHDTVVGGPGNDYVKGGEGNDTLVGGSGENILDGEGGNDTLVVGHGDTAYGGEGDDTFEVKPIEDIDGDGKVDENDLAAFKMTIDGGAGHDTLDVDVMFTDTIDFSNMNNASIKNIEALKLGADDTVKLSINDVLNMTDGDDKLFINGEGDGNSGSSSTVNIDSNEWTKTNTTEQDGNGTNYEVYSASDNSGATLLVEQNVVHVDES